MPDTENDIKLIRRGDSEAFARVLETYAPLINAISEKYVREYTSLHLSADDIKQEAAIALYSAALTYKPGEVTFGLYAKVCIKNRLISYIRGIASKVLKERISEDIDGYSASRIQASPDEQPLNAIISQESFEQLRTKIRGCLTAYEYDVFSLYTDGVPLKEISARLGKTQKSVYSTLNRVRTKLKKLVLDTKSDNMPR